jgi:hypothetical protein
MAVLTTPTNIQKIEFDVTTAEGPSRVTIVTGTMPVPLFVSNGSESASFKALLDPTLTAGQFRKATATASFNSIGIGPSVGGPLLRMNWEINDAQATLDDEAGRVQLVVDLTITAEGQNPANRISTVNFQVTTLARVEPPVL